MLSLPATFHTSARWQSGLTALFGCIALRAPTSSPWSSLSVTPLFIRVWKNSSQNLNLMWTKECLTILIVFCSYPVYVPALLLTHSSYPIYLLFPSAVPSWLYRSSNLLCLVRATLLLASVLTLSFTALFFLMPSAYLLWYAAFLVWIALSTSAFHHQDSLGGRELPTLVLSNTTCLYCRNCGTTFFQMWMLLHMYAIMLSYGQLRRPLRQRTIINVGQSMSRRLKLAWTDSQLAGSRQSTGIGPTINYLFQYRTPFIL